MICISMFIVTMMEMTKVAETIICCQSYFINENYDDKISIDDESKTET